MNIPQLVSKYEAQLVSVNPLLQTEELPAFYLGFGRVHVDYDLENTPRVIWRWWPPGAALDQLYLVHKPSGRIVNIHGIASGRPYIA